MARTRRELGVCILRWVLGLVVLVQSILLLFFSGPVVHLGRHELPNAIRYGLGGSEAVAALLFLVPPTRIIGAYALMAVFVGAIGVHFLHGQTEVGGLLVYLAAALAVAWDRPA